MEVLATKVVAVKSSQKDVLLDASGDGKKVEEPLGMANR